jgi:signal transduction histidine kinase
MSGLFWLDWATVAVSLANAILLLWLGATVLLNADRRAWGIWLAGGGMLVGGAFFISHTAFLSLDFRQLTAAARFWWYGALAPAVLMPLLWYLAMVWYAGYGEAPRSAWSQRRQRWLWLLLLAAAAGISAAVIYFNPFPRVLSLLPLRFALANVGGSTLLGVGYAVYLALCIGLSLDALLRPGPTARIMGDLARQRARSWLVAATLLFLLVSLLVIGGLSWMLLFVRAANGIFVITPDVLLTLAWLDLLTSLVIGAAVVLLGQAVVAYEIFTGKTLPRQGLRRQWQRALLLAAGYGFLVGLALTAHLRPVYGVLLATVLMTAFFALLVWQSYRERERTIAALRPFVSSQQLYDRLLAPAAESDAPLDAPPELDAAAPFAALCRHVLGARCGYLVALGPMAPLAGPPLAYPEPAPLPSLEDVIRRLASPQTLRAPLDPAVYAGAAWAISLWGERGLIGLLLLGEKAGGGLYTQEEMEIARASGERLVDMQAAAEMGRRLLALQRQRLVATQVADRQTRRMLHDDVLPQLHAALLALAAGGEDVQTATSLIGDAHRQIANLLRDVPPAVTPGVARLGVLGALEQALAEFDLAFDEVVWEVEPGAAERLRALPPLTAEVLFYAAREAVRNAARHGRGEDGGPLKLRVCAAAADGAVMLVVEDDGVGLDPAGAYGRGLALHSTTLAVVGGALAVESGAGRGTRVRLEVTTRESGSSEQAPG